MRRTLPPSRTARSIFATAWSRTTFAAPHKRCGLRMADGGFRLATFQSRIPNPEPRTPNPEPRTPSPMIRPHPHLYEINTWPWLEMLSRAYGRRLTLGTVPDELWDRLRAIGVDLVYLMGVWRRSALGRQLARSDTRLYADYDRALPAWRVRDVVGSAFCVVAHEPDPRVGTWDDLDEVREKLHARGMRLMVDFIANHSAF